MLKLLQGFSCIKLWEPNPSQSRIQYQVSILSFNTKTGLSESGNSLVCVYDNGAHVGDAPYINCTVF